MQFNKTTLKTCLGILCLLPVLAVGLPQSIGANFFMKEIKLTRGMSALVDDEDFEYLAQFKWRVVSLGNGGDHLYAGRTARDRKPCGEMVLMHREIMGVRGKPENLIDHKNRNGLDNRKLNLRPCDRHQNSANRRSKIGASSGFLGVFFYKRDRNWTAKIRFNKKLYHLGYFDDEIKAALAYNDAAIQYHGEFANLNIIK